ncbi:hypothetical protein SprV_0200719200 [Sparganum proliferum]
MWHQGQVSQDLGDPKTHLYKREENPQLYDNHRGIPLLNFAGKIFARVLFNRLNSRLEQRRLPGSQCGFCRHCGTTDIVFAASQLQNKCQEMRSEHFSTFETRPVRFKTTPASKGNQDPTPIANGSSRLPERRHSKREIIQSDISDMQASAEACHRCHKIVYPIDRASTGKHVYHQFCLRCAVCDRSLTSSNFESSNGSIFCRPHFLEKVRNITRSNSSLSSASYRGPLAGQESDLYTPLVFGSDKCLQPPAVRLT